MPCPVLTWQHVHTCALASTPGALDHLGTQTHLLVCLVRPMAATCECRHACRVPVLQHGCAGVPLCSPATPKQCCVLGDRLLSLLPCPNVIKCWHRRVCSYACHAPLALQHLQCPQTATWQCRHACLSTCSVPTLLRDDACLPVYTPAASRHAIQWGGRQACSWTRYTCHSKTVRFCTHTAATSQACHVVAPTPLFAHLL